MMILFTGNYRHDRHVLQAVKYLLGNPTAKEIIEFNKIEWSDEAMENCECHPAWKGEMNE